MDDEGLYERALTLLRELVAIPSVNPLNRESGEAGPELPAELAGEKRVVDYLEQHVRSLGLPYDRYEVLPCRPSLVTRLAGASANVLALVGHTDTVGVRGFGGDPFSGEFRDGRLYGRGSVDAKGPLVAGLLALELLQQRALPPPVTVLLGAVCDEEYRGRGVRKLVRLSPHTRAAVVLEPTRLETVIATNGGARWLIRTRGRSVHSCRAQEGLNAIRLMAEVVQVICRVVDPWLLERRHPLCGTPPSNIGWIRGGANANVVPDLCEIELYVRTHPGETPADIVAAVNGLIREALPAEVAEHVEFVKPYHTSRGFTTNPQDPLVQALQRAAQSLGLEGRIAGRPYGSDASFLATKGIVSVLFGPGDDRAAHGADESIEVAEVVTAAKVLTEAVCTLRLD